MKAVYDDIQALLSRDGYPSVLRPTAARDYELAVMPPIDSGGRPALVITHLGGEWYVGGLRVRGVPKFRIGGRTNVFTAVRSLLPLVSASPAGIPPAEFDAIKARFDLVPISLGTWHSLLDNERSRRDAARGWTTLSKAANSAAWDEFERRFPLRLGMSPETWPAINEPSPSVTFDLTQVCDLARSEGADGGRGYAAAECELERHFLRCFRGCTPTDGRVLALNYNHDGYSFDPAALAEPHEDDLWPETMAPIDEYRVFGPPGYHFGAFAHPWERSLCVFGRAFLDAVLSDRPRWLGPILRRRA